jgi:hypothetical protein
MDGSVLNKQISNEGAPAAPGASSNVSVNQPGLTRYNSGVAGGAVTRQNVQSVQLAAPTGLMPIAGSHVTPAVLETMKGTSPELFVAPEVKAAEVKAVEAVAAKETADRVELNRYRDDAVEGVAMHIASDVQFADQVRVLHELHTTGTVSEPTLNRVADQLHLSVSETVDALNAITTHSNLQLAALCGAAGVDSQAFAGWMKQHHSTELFKAVQVATQGRDIQRAWGSHIAAFKARGQR